MHILIVLLSMQEYKLCNARKTAACYTIFSTLHIEFLAQQLLTTCFPLK